MDRELTAATLHIGGLDLAATKVDLFSAFKNYRQLLKFVTIRSSTGGLNCANVHFSTREAAEMACKELNGALILGRRVTVDALNPDFNVFVNNFPENVTDRDLEQEFAPCGRILSVQVPSDQAGRCRGYGFIQFVSAEATAQALAKDGQQWRGDRLRVEPFKSSEERQLLVNLLVFGFDHSTSKADFDALFGQFGRIATSQIQQKRVDGKLKSLGFVTYKEVSSAAAAVTALNQREALGGLLTVQSPVSPTAIPQSFKSKVEKKHEKWKQTNLMFTLLPPSVTENDLLQMCQVHGRVTSIRIPYKQVEEARNGTVIYKTVPTGAAFVNFEDPESAERARMALDRRLMKSCPIGVKYWRPRDDFGQRSWTQPWKYGTYKQVYDSPSTAFRPVSSTQALRKAAPASMSAPRPATASLPAPQPLVSSVPAPQPSALSPPVTQSIAASLPVVPPPSVPAPKPVTQPAKGSKPSAAHKQAATTHWVKRKVDKSTELRSQKQAMGEALHPLVLSLTNPDIADKVTGMLLELSIPELIKTTEDLALLRRHVSETLEVLRAAWSADEKMRVSLDLLKLKNA